ncbi:VOC family protein [Sciscionella marina]|uniref:VOC family protein n=1 Tax=Sciscionella marina TaxID=508770 RepID=UPI00036CE361|nr:VOC family protein [Sciscionella marina]
MNTERYAVARTTMCSLRLDSPDPASADDFYSALAGRPRAAAFSGDSTLPTARQRIAHSHPSDVSRWIVGFAVADVPAALERCTAAGAVVQSARSHDGALRIRDPDGALFELWSVGTGHRDPGTHDVVLADLYTRQVADATSFYSSALDLRADVLPDEPSDYIMLSAAGTHVAGILDMTSFLEPATPAQWLPYFHYPTVDRGIARATALGAWVVVPRSPSPTGEYALLQDSWGGLFGLWDGRSLAQPGTAGHGGLSGMGPR